MVCEINITIVIAYYNIRYFEETLRSLSRQTDSRFKVFVGNDCSAEDPKDIIKKFESRLNIEYVEFEDNLGGKDLTKQWVRCLRYVTTPYFLILGDDDMLSDDSIYEFNQEISESSVTYPVYRLGIVRINGSGIPITDKIIYKDLEASSDFLIRRTKNEVISSLGEYIFSIENYKNAGIKSYPKAFYSDNMMVLEISKFQVIKNIKNAYSLIRVSEYSFSGASINEVFLHKAASLFYYDLINHYSHHFKNKDLKYFIPPLIYGKKHNIIDIKWTEILFILFKSRGLDVIKRLIVEKLRK